MLTIKTTGIGQETQRVSNIRLDIFNIAPNGRHDYDASLLSLKFLDAPDLDLAREWTYYLADFTALSVIRGNDPDLLIGFRGGLIMRTRIPTAHLLSLNR
jgi:hypothetical protein